MMGITIFTDKIFVDRLPISIIKDGRYWWVSSPALSPIPHGYTDDGNINKAINRFLQNADLFFHAICKMETLEYNLDKSGWLSSLDVEPGYSPNGTEVNYWSCPIPEEKPHLFLGINKTYEIKSK